MPCDYLVGNQTLTVGLLRNSASPYFLQPVGKVSQSISIDVLSSRFPFAVLSAPKLVVSRCSRDPLSWLASPHRRDRQFRPSAEGGDLADGTFGNRLGLPASLDHRDRLSAIGSLQQQPENTTGRAWQSDRQLMKRCLSCSCRLFGWLGISRRTPPQWIHSGLIPWACSRHWRFWQA